MTVQYKHTPGWFSPGCYTGARLVLVLQFPVGLLKLPYGAQSELSFAPAKLLITKPSSPMAARGSRSEVVKLT